MLFVTRNFVVDRTWGTLELLRQDGITGPARLGADVLVRLGLAGHAARRFSAPGSPSSCPASTPGSMTTAHLIASGRAEPQGAERGLRLSSSPARRGGKVRPPSRTPPPLPRTLQIQLEQPARRLGAAAGAVAQGGAAVGRKPSFAQHPARGRIVDEMAGDEPRRGAANGGHWRAPRARPRWRSRGPSKAARSSSRTRRSPGRQPAEADAADQPRRAERAQEDEAARLARRRGRGRERPRRRQDCRARARWRGCGRCARRAIASSSAGASSLQPGLSNSLSVLANICLSLPLRRPPLPFRGLRAGDTV